MMSRYQDKHQLEHLPQFSIKSPVQCVLGQDGWRSKRIGCSRLTLNFSHISLDKNDEATPGQASAGAYLPQLCSKSPMHCVLGHDGSRAKPIGCRQLTPILFLCSVGRKRRGDIRTDNSQSISAAVLRQRPMPCVLRQDGW